MKRILILFVAVAALSSCKTTSVAQSRPSGDVEARLKELNIQLPVSAPYTGSIVKAVRTGNLVFLSGHGPDKPGGGQITGKVGGNLSIEQGQEAARLTGIALLASLKAEIGDLNKVKRIVKVLGMVNCPQTFTQQPAVINGFSDMIVSIFGERGRHARSAVGMAGLPNDIAVEIEMIVEVAD